MNKQQKTFSLRVVVQVVLFILIVPFLPLLISGHWEWWEAWAFAVISILGFVISRLLVRRRHPDLIAERARFLQHEDAKSWDKLLAPLVGLGGNLVPLVAGLEALWDWSSKFSLPVKILAGIVLLAGYVLSSYALIENRFFSGMVRVQSERGHQVVSSGPYRWMRHPGYAGALLVYLATPLFLDSSWAYLPAVFFMVIVILRTHLEDKTLQEELEGYRDYAQRVRYRLLPGIW